MTEEVPNRLINESSPYLLQHAHNPVDWYPWGEEAFEKAEKEDKSVFLSIGYSCCHWCHVMARESFEDENIAEYLNRYFVSVKVDREERPDIDSVYMAICQAFTGGGGWPTSIFMTPDQKPFFAGTYFPPDSRYGRIGFKDLLEALHEAWVTRRQELLQSAENAAAVLEHAETEATAVNSGLIERAVEGYKRSFDEKNGGFGGAPKFPAAHNLLFLINYYEKSGDANALKMAEKTLTQMYRGGLFDHVGGGFCRYSTDAIYLAPHFEKMLYDNGLLILAYCKAYEVTKKPFYRNVAQRTAAYVLREMTSSDDGGFYSAQDADSEGVEGKYYLFEPAELLTLLGPEDGAEFNRHYDVTPEGNFEGKSIPNLLKTEGVRELDKYLTRVYRYRRERGSLHLDDKVLTTWNSLMIAALCRLYRISADPIYLEAALKARWFIEKRLREENSLFVSYRLRRGVPGFLDDYACYALALLEIYGATLNSECLDSARRICDRAIEEFWDDNQGGFFLSGKNNEKLMSRMKESYDGAMPSGNSLMAYVLGRLDLLTPDGEYGEIVDKQLAFMSGEAEGFPTGYAMFLLALAEHLDPPPALTVVLKPGDSPKELPLKLTSDVLVKVLDSPTERYPLSNGETTYYVCMGNSCRPPVNDPAMLQINR